MDFQVPEVTTTFGTFFVLVSGPGLSSDVLKTVCANLLRYGGEAQKYFGYRTDSLADEEHTQDKKSHLIDTETLSLVNHRTQCKVPEAMRFRHYFS